MVQRSAPSHYLIKCWNIVYSNIRSKLQWNLKQNSHIFIQENSFEYVVWKMVTILSRPQCENWPWVITAHRELWAKTVFISETVWMTLYMSRVYMTGLGLAHGRQQCVFSQGIMMTNESRVNALSINHLRPVSLRKTATANEQTKNKQTNSNDNNKNKHTCETPGN